MNWKTHIGMHVEVLNYQTRDMTGFSMRYQFAGSYVKNSLVINLAIL